MEPRIALLDIETAPSLGYVWAKYQTDVLDFHTPWYVLCFAYKWLGEKKTHVRALPDYPKYNKDRECDRSLMQDLRDEVLDKATHVIAHNGDRFDLRKANARFVLHGFDPPSPFKSIDTLKIARKHFKFDSNRLDDLGQYLDLGRKLPHIGFRLWHGCMAGDANAWRLMKRYNVQDVQLLERVYYRLRPWASSHPNLSYLTRADACPTCQSSRIKQSGWAYVASGRKQRSTCLDCGFRFVSGKLERLPICAKTLKKMTTN